MEDGKFSVTGSPQKSVTFGEVAATANLSNTLAPGIEPGLETTVFWEPEACVFPFGTHICVVEVDKDTGEAEIMRFIAVDDCGRQLNPMIVEGQVHGGIAQGVGQAMIRRRRVWRRWAASHFVFDGLRYATCERTAQLRAG